MDSYASFRLTDWDWISRYKEKMGTDHFRDYVNGVYSELMKMRVGGVFSLDNEVREENRELFIKIVCMFILEGNSDYDFSSDYKTIRRHEKATLVRKQLGKTELAVKLYIHRKNIVYRPSVKRNLVLELFRIKLVNPEYFAVTKEFLRAVNINQVRFWKLYRGEESPTDAEYLRLATTLKVSLQEAFEARQLSLFNDNIKIDDTSKCD